MSFFKITFLNTLLLMAGLSLNAQDSLQIPAQLTESKKTIECTVDVTGVCVMCKDRIENAALIKGVKLAEWEAESGKLRLIYRADRVVLDSILSGVAKAGHDNEKFKAPDEAYNKLPDCCAYRDGVEKH